MISIWFYDTLSLVTLAQYFKLNCLYWSGLKKKVRNQVWNLVKRRNNVYTCKKHYHTHREYIWYIYICIYNMFSLFPKPQKHFTCTFFLYKKLYIVHYIKN